MGQLWGFEAKQAEFYSRVYAIRIENTAANSGVPLEARVRFLACFEAECAPSGADRLALAARRVSALEQAARFREAAEAVTQVLGDLDPALREPPVCAAPDDAADAELQSCREIFRLLQAQRVSALAGMGVGEEELETVRVAARELARMRSTWVPGEVLPYDRGYHTDVATRHVGALMALGRFDAAIPELEGLIEERSLFEARESLQQGPRPELEAKLRILLAIARIAVDAMSAPGSDAGEAYGMARAELGRVLELVSASAEDPWAESIELDAQLWRAWIDLEAIDPTRSEALDRARLLASGGSRFDPASRRMLWTLEARAIRRLGSGPLSEAQSALGLELLERAFGSFEEQWSAIAPRDAGLGPLSVSQDTEILREALAYAALTHEDPVDRARAVVAAYERMAALGSLPRLLGASPGEYRDVLDRAVAGSSALLLAVPVGYGPAELVLLEEDRATFGRAASESRITSALQRFAAWVGTQPARRRPGRQALGELLRDRMLPAGIQGRLGELDRLVVVGFDSFGPVPFAALPWQGGGSFGERFPLIELPSLGVAGALPAVEAIPERLVLITNPTTDDPETTLALEPEILDHLVEGWSEPAVHTGDSATPARLRAEAASGATRTDALVLMAHGVRDPSFVRAAGIQLTPEAEAPGDSGLLLAKDVQGLALDGVDLVVLAACGAAREPLRAGDAGSASLPGAFLRAGVGATLHAGGDLPTEATARLIGVLLQRWRAGVPLEVALRDARRSVATEAGTADVFFHGQLRLLLRP